ncbi:MAG: hypothetical protein RLZ53_1014 [Actinomycetota bacterium]
MINLQRIAVSAVAILFALFHAILGALSWDKYDQVSLLVASLGIYLITVTLSLILRPGIEMGWLLAVVAVVGALATAIVANAGIGAGETGTYASWYVGGMGVLLGIVAVRGQAIFAWIAAILVTLVVVQAAGLGGILTAGVIGMVVLIAAGQGTARALRRADRELAELQESEKTSQIAIWSAESSARERRSRLQNVLEQALPALSQISSKSGKLNQSERESLLNLEANLRDEIRGRSLVNDEVRKAVTAARFRGIQVLLLDEGGLDALTEKERKHVLSKVAGAIDSVKEGKVTVRSPRGESFVVTVVATRPGTSAPDLWLRL